MPRLDIWLTRNAPGSRLARFAPPLEQPRRPTVAKPRNIAAFDVADNTELTVLDILLKTDKKTRDGLLYDLDGDEDIDDFELTLRLMANAVYTNINEQGDI